MDSIDIEEKWNTRYLEREVESRNISDVLAQHQHLLPRRGRALEIACGLGANALFMARLGLEVDAWDISPVAIDKLNDYCRDHGIHINASVRDVRNKPPARESYDVIVVSYFLQRELAPAITEALRPGGLLFYQTHIHDKVDDSGPSNPDFLLKSNELLNLFNSLTILAYREEGRVGDIRRGFRNAAMLVGIKHPLPSSEHQS